MVKMIAAALVAALSISSVSAAPRMEMEPPPSYLIAEMTRDDFNKRLATAMPYPVVHLHYKFDGVKHYFAIDMDVDQRWLAIGRTHVEEAFMAINRSLFKPQRLP